MCNTTSAKHHYTDSCSDNLQTDSGFESETTLSDSDYQEAPTAAATTPIKKAVGKRRRNEDPGQRRSSYRLYLKAKAAGVATYVHEGDPIFNYSGAQDPNLFPELFEDEEGT